MATIDDQTLERAAVAAWNGFRGAQATPPGVFSHPWEEVPEKPYRRAWRSGMRAAFAVLDGATPDGLAEDGPGKPPPESNTQDADATGPGEVLQVGDVVPPPPTGEGG